MLAGSFTYVCCTSLFRPCQLQVCQEVQSIVVGHRQYLYAPMLRQITLIWCCPSQALTHKPTGNQVRKSVHLWPASHW